VKLIFRTFISSMSMIFNDFNSSDDGLSKVKEYDAEVILVLVPLFVFVPSCIVLIIFFLQVYEKYFKST